MSQERFDPNFLHPHGEYTRQPLPAFHKPLGPHEYPRRIPLQRLVPTLDNAETLRLRSPNLDQYGRIPTFDDQPRLHDRWRQSFRTPLRSRFDPSTPSHTENFIIHTRGLFTRFCIEWWVIELVSWSISAVCMAAIIAVLSYYNGKPLPQWKLGITLNGYISVFSGLAKAALLLPIAECIGQLKWNWFRRDSRKLMDFEILDSASRGPWGALLLLLRTRGTTLSSIGAAIILAALPLSVFFQQIVNYPSVWVPVSPAASMPRTVTYLPPNQLSFMNGNSVLNNDEYLTATTLPVLISNGTVPELELYCPTSNCTWDPLETLGVCGTCDQSISQELSFGCFEGPADWTTNATTGNATTYPNITSCGYWLNATSDSRLLMTGYAVDPVTNLPGEALRMRLFPLRDAFTRQPFWEGSLRFKNIEYPILDFFVVGTPGSAANVYQNVTPVGSECVLNWCVQRLESSYWWGHLEQNVTATWQNEKDENDEKSPWIIDTFPDGSTDYTYATNISITAPLSRNPFDEGSGGDSERNLTFGLSNDTALQTIFLMDNFVPSLLTLSSASSESTFKYNIPDPAGARTRTLPYNPWLPPYNVTDHVRKMADVMSASIRNSPGNVGKIERISGTAWDTRIYVQTRWAWISLPLILLGFGLCFLLATVIKSSREEHEVGIFKTSALAILFNGLGEEVQKSVGPNFRMGRAIEKARQLKVKLVPD